MSIVEKLIKTVRVSSQRPDHLSITEEEVSDLADHFLSIRRMRGSGFEKADFEEMIRLGHVQVVGIPVKVAA